MSELTLNRNNRVKVLLWLLVFLITAGWVLFAPFVEAKGTKKLPEPKSAETFSEDWLANQLAASNSDISSRPALKRAAPVKVQYKLQRSNPDVKNPVSFQETDDSDFNASPSGTTTNPDEPVFQDVKGGITDIRATVGKSQIIQFAQPIKRLSITDPSLADLILLSPTQMILNGKAAGVTSLIIWDETDQPAFFELYVQNDVSDLMDALKLVAPDEPLNLKLTDDGNVILGGTISSSIVRDQIEKIAKGYGYTLIDVSESPVPQVVLELRIAEISRSLSKNFNLTIVEGQKAVNFDPTMQPPAIPPPLGRDLVGTAGSRPWNKAQVASEWNGASTNGFRIAFFHAQWRINALFQMGQARGLLNILAEPKLVTTHGRASSFDAGNSVPVPTGVDQNGNLAYEYKDIGVNIKFTPWISEKSQRIELKLEPSVSEIDPSVTITQPNGTQIFGFRNRKASTTVELESGETLMLAGLIRRADNNTSSEIPFLSDIPIIGKIFSSTSFRRDESELVIMVTPRIVKPGVYGDVVGSSE